jgi:hypothetical protein
MAPKYECQLIEVWCSGVRIDFALIKVPHVIDPVALEFCISEPINHESSQGRFYGIDHILYGKTYISHEIYI